MAKVKMTADIIHQTELSKDIFSLTLKAPAIAKEAKAGQFVSLFPNDESKLLPRPISICGADPSGLYIGLPVREPENFPK